MNGKSHMAGNGGNVENSDEDSAIPIRDASSQIHVHCKIEDLPISAVDT
jgi:hypothetical protein